MLKLLVYYFLCSATSEIVALEPSGSWSQQLQEFVKSKFDYKTNLLEQFAGQFSVLEKLQQKLANVLDKLPAPIQEEVRSYLEARKTQIIQGMDKKIVSLQDRGAPQFLIEKLIKQRQQLTDLWFPTTTPAPTTSKMQSFLRKVYEHFTG